MAVRQGYGTFLVAALCLATWMLCGHAAAAVRLELKLDKGKTYYERSLIEQKITQEVMGQQQVINLAIGIGEKLDVLEVDQQGNMRVRHTYIRSKFKQTGPMMAVDYDSAQHATAPAGAEAFAALLGLSYTMRITPRGEVLDITGIAELAKTVREKAPNADLSAQGNPVAALLDAQTVKSMTENSLGVYPDRPVAPGDSWTRTRLTKQGTAMITQHQWTLQKLEGGVATVSSTSTLKPDPNGPPMEMQGMAMKLDLSGTQESTIQMAEKTGLMKTNEGHQMLKGQIRIGSSPQGPFDMMAIPMTIEAKFMMEMGDRMWEKEAK